MRQRKVARCQAVPAQVDQRRRNDREVRDAHRHGQHQKNIPPRGGGCGAAQLLFHAAATLAADKIVAFARSDVVLQEPHAQTDAHQYAGQRRRTAEVDRRNGSMAMDLRCKHFKTDPFSQRSRGSIFRKCFDKYQQCTDGIISAEQRQKNLAKPRTEARAKHGPGFFQTGRNVEHGIFEDRQHKRENVQAHHQNQPAQCKEHVLRTRCGGDKLLQKSLFLHEQYPAHRGNVGRCHKRNHKNNVKDTVLCKLRAREQIRQRCCNSRGQQHNQHAQQ